VSELESEMWIGESGLTATTVIGPQHLGPLVLCAGVRDASTDHVRLSRAKRAHSAQTTLSTSPQPLPRDFSSRQSERRAQAPSISQHKPA
jgi:hypothetical protein